MSCPLFFRAATSSVVPAAATFLHEIAGSYMVHLKFPLHGRRQSAGRRQTQQAARASRLPATQVFQILQEKSFLSMEVQYFSIISFVSHKLISLPKAVPRYFGIWPHPHPPRALSSYCYGLSVWTTVVTARNSQAMTVPFPQALDGALPMIPFLWLWAQFSSC